MVIAQNPMERVFSIFTELTGKKVYMKEYAHRLIVQKLTFLIQDHLSKTYRYNWYIRGPYSPSVSEEAFELFEQKKVNFEMNKMDLNILNKLKQLLGSDTPELQIDDKLELYASIVFLKKQRGLEHNTEIIEKLHSLKPWLSGNEIDSAIKELKNAHFL